VSVSGPRVLAGVIAAVAWSGLAMQMGLLVSSFVADGSGPLAGVWRFFGYFTLLTNLLVALVASAFALGRSPGSQVLTATTLYILIVGLVYHVLLSGTWSPRGIALIADRITHYATPALMAAFWLTCLPKGVHAWRDVAGWLLYPVGYLAWMLARGALDGFYPYFFVDPTKTGWTQLAVNATGLCAVFAVCGLVLVAIDKWMGRR
jgi:hypothetical protein